ncbi:TRAP-type C4-dicarboxylate transport system, small permease component [Palleronia marisminoris]|uniref:TRAP transporter small permease protein n=1 Tax=Palleronia marisminoris TaxID=315423 RepID=A0A1Y5SA25_9RHOB|nr:TRAP transporter small permease [Palleronia marisminoris]SFG70464.1 TRAP-type C4-dicarboxylate transport system, small permease component [Palleronia marisminoris]SLN35955.1 2,3-diketo-L-gulonate TRAP transporter small permease protein YiaM [Palleronia marisminoris]
MIRLANNLERALAAVLRPVVFAGMAALAVVITLQIVSRVLFTAVSWTEEMARFLLVWLTFLGATLALAEKRHIAVTLLTDRMPPALGRAAAIAGLVTMTAFLIALTWIGWSYMSMQSFQRSASLQMPMMYVYAVIPVSGALMSVLCLADLAATVAGRSSRAEP